MFIKLKPNMVLVPMTLQEADFVSCFLSRESDFEENYPDEVDYDEQWGPINDVASRIDNQVSTLEYPDVFIARDGDYEISSVWSDDEEAAAMVKRMTEKGRWVEKISHHDYKVLVFAGANYMRKAQQGGE